MWPATVVIPVSALPRILRQHTFHGGHGMLSQQTNISALCVGGGGGSKASEGSGELETIETGMG